MAECKFNCESNPDAVDKINWKCVECGKDLKTIQATVIKARADAYTARLAEEEANRPGISQEEIDHRRAMANE